MSAYHFFVPCALGLEELLREELESLGAQEAKATNSGVSFSGSLELGYRVCLWSRIGSRVLLKLCEGEVHDRYGLESLAQGYSWTEVFNARNTFAVRFNGTSETLKNTQFSAQVIKDGIVDTFRRANERRPDVDIKQPEIAIQGYLSKGIATLYLDFAGVGLHERGYRQAKGAAPIRETLAAAILYRLGLRLPALKDEQATPWPSLIADPTCGSGTLLIEAALLATDRAPGLGRTKWGFNAWRGHDAALWNKLKSAANERFMAGKTRCDIHFHGVDEDATTVHAAQQNIVALGLEQFIKVEQGDARSPWLMQRYKSAPSGLLISNPPYGERLGTAFSAWKFYRDLGHWLQKANAENQLSNWRAAILAPDESMIRAMRLRTEKKYKFNNGGIPIILALFDLGAEHPVFERPEVTALINRLQKNWKQREKWARQEGVDCFRVYDADLPEFNAAIDFYNGALVLQEYAAPKNIPEATTQKRWWNVIEAALDSLPVDPSLVFTRQRRRQQGEQQYTRLSEASVLREVSEYNAKFLVNLTDYLDTGLFLDHRWVRREIQRLSSGKKVLNLFAYTGSASVHAALGGASHVTTVDLSKTYLNWAKDNFRLNKLTLNKHLFVQADCLSWLAEASRAETPEQYNLIFIDPPSFSNSKRMSDIFDVQRDHGKLLRQAKRILAADGLIIFTNNKRGFKLDSTLAEIGLLAEDHTRPSIPPDFAKQRAVHVCWYLRHA